MGDAGTIALQVLKPEDWDYLVYKSGSTYYCRTAATGITSSNSDFASLVNPIIAAASAGQTMVLNPGTYTRTAQIDIQKSNFTLMGLGKVSLYSTTGVNGIVCGDGTNTYTGIRIENIGIDQGGYEVLTNDHHCIWLQKVNDFVVTRCDLGNDGPPHQLRAACIRVQDCIRGEISVNHCHDYINGIVLDATTTEGIRVVANHCHHIDPFDCITSYRNQGKHTIVGNICHDGFYSGILLEGGSGVFNKGCTVTGNVCHDVQYGIFVYGANTGAIAGNNCYNCTNFGINVRSAGNCEFAISGNDVYNSTNAGIHVESTQHGTIDGNNIVENQGQGIFMESSSHRWNISGNHIYKNAKEGILFDACAESMIVANTLSENSQLTHNTYSEIKLQNASTAHIVEANRFSISSSTTNRSKYSIEEGATTETGNIYRNNFFSVLNPTGKLLILSTTSKAYANENYNTENSGTSTQSGNASTTVFNIAHGLTATPTWVNVVANSVDARGTPSVTLGSTNITLTYPVPPPTGTNNLAWNWQAGVYVI